MLIAQETAAAPRATLIRVAHEGQCGGILTVQRAEGAGGEAVQRPGEGGDSFEVELEKDLVRGRADTALGSSSRRTWREGGEGGRGQARGAPGYMPADREHTGMEASMLAHM